MAGGITVSAFVAYWWLTTRYDTFTGVVARSFTALGLLQTGSFLAARWAADRIGCCPPWWSPTWSANLLLK